MFPPPSSPFPDNHPHSYPTLQFVPRCVCYWDGRIKWCAVTSFTWAGRVIPSSLYSLLSFCLRTTVYLLLPIFLYIFLLSFLLCLSFHSLFPCFSSVFSIPSLLPPPSRFLSTHLSLFLLCFFFLYSFLLYLFLSTLLSLFLLSFLFIYSLSPSSSLFSLFIPSFLPPLPLSLFFPCFSSFLFVFSLSPSSSVAFHSSFPFRPSFPAVLPSSNIVLIEANNVRKGLFIQ